MDARRHSRDLPPWKQQEAAVVPPATWMPLSSYSPLRRGCEAAVGIPATWMLEDELITSAALPWMRGGCRTSCDVQARKPKSSYLLPRRRCEAAVALHATFKPGSRSRLTCCLAVDARRLSSYLPTRHGCEAAVGKLAVMTWKPRRRSRLTRRLAVDARRLSANLRTGGLCRPKCHLAVDARRRSPYLSS